MFRVRWAKSVLKEDRYFTTMVIPEAKSKTAGANVTAKNEPSLLGKSLAAAQVLGLSVARAGALLIRRYS